MLEFIDFNLGLTIHNRSPKTCVITIFAGVSKSKLGGYWAGKLLNKDKFFLF